VSYKDNKDGLSIDSVINFKPLEFPFDKSGFRHELIKRDGLICLVRRSRIDHPDTPPHCEVVKLRQKPAWVCPATGVQIPPKEVYPDAERWGDIGFTYNTMDSALSKFDSLCLPIAPRLGLESWRYITISRNEKAAVAADLEVAA
jgi:hypothetical protein